MAWKQRRGRESCAATCGGAQAQRQVHTSAAASCSAAQDARGGQRTHIASTRANTKLITSPHTHLFDGFCFARTLAVASSAQQIAATKRHAAS